MSSVWVVISRTSHELQSTLMVSFFQDILENDALKLDDDFKNSLLLDVVKVTTDERLRSDGIGPTLGLPDNTTALHTFGVLGNLPNPSGLHSRQFMQ